MKAIQSQALGIVLITILVFQSALLISCCKQASQSSLPPEPVVSSTNGYAEINSVKLYYQITGEGEPLLLLHGGLGGSEHFERIIPELAKSFKVISVDRRGHGRSFDNAEPYSYAGMADEMKAFLDQIQVAAVDIIGFSDGGVVGYHLASTYPEKVNKLVAVGANYRVDGMTQATIDWARDRLTPENLIADLPAVEQGYTATNPQPENYAEFVQRSRELWLRDPYLTDEQMKGIQAPVLFVVGEKDAIRIEHVLEMRTLVEEPHLCVLPGATHFVLSEQPEIVLPIIMNFFKS